MYMYIDTDTDQLGWLRILNPAAYPRQPACAPLLAAKASEDADNP